MRIDQVEMFHIRIPLRSGLKINYQRKLNVEKLILASNTPEARIYEGGTVDVPSGPGIGVQISEETLRRFTVAQQMVK